MGDEDNKPFPCTSPGCSMKFVNEDHLSIHKKRHMSLSIESNGSKNFIADETPTPTRFIRNCEEVGLFQDLQNVNPFDEQFRRAAEVTLTSPAHSMADDVLHTPHVFPSTETELPAAQLPPPKSASARSGGNRSNYLMPSLSTSECLPSPLCTPVPSSVTPAIVVTAPIESQEAAATAAAHSPSKPEPAKPTRATRRASAIVTSSASSAKKERGRKTSLQSTVNKTVVPPTSGVNILPRPVVPAVSSASSSDPMTALLFRLPDGRLVQIPAIPVSSEVESTVSIQPAPVPVSAEQPNSQPARSAALSEAKMKLKQALTKTKTVMQTSNAASPSIPSDASGTDTDQGAIISDAVMTAADDTKAPNNRRRSYNSASDPDMEDEESEKRRKFLERNRAAAFRSRQKRKRWVSNLEAKTNAMNAANRLLQNEVIALRSEVAQLKLQLLAHKDCPVTLAMCGQQPLVVAATNNNHEQRLVGATAQSTTGVINTVMTEQPQTRQIIILNTSNQNAASLQFASNKPGQPSMVLNNPQPVVMVPEVQHNPDVTDARRNSTSDSQQSVIMSVTLPDK